MFFNRRADDFSSGDSGYDMGPDTTADTADCDASQEGICDDTAFSDEDFSEALDSLDDSSLENLNDSDSLSDDDEIDEALDSLADSSLENLNDSDSLSDDDEIDEILNEISEETNVKDEVAIDLNEETSAEEDGLLEIPHDENEVNEETEVQTEPELTESAENLSQTDIQETQEELPDSMEETAFSELQETKDVQSVDDISGWVGDINPNFDPFDMDSPYCNNCGSCALAVEKMLDGAENAEASDVNIGTVAEMEDLTGMTQMKMDYVDIENYLHMQGPGSHGIVGIDRVDGPGHWFNAYFDGKNVVCIDGQTGEVSGWPPDYGNVSNVDFSVRKAV